jgi:hypothetical protein
MGFNLDDYEPVASRLDRFLKAHPDARVITDLVHYLADVAVFKCELWLNDEIIATGWAEEVRGQGNVNKTSHLSRTAKQGQSVERSQMLACQVATLQSDPAEKKCKRLCATRVT